jgi:hypothetical protein
LPLGRSHDHDHFALLLELGYLEADTQLPDFPIVQGRRFEANLSHGETEFIAEEWGIIPSRRAEVVFHAFQLHGCAPGFGDEHNARIHGPYEHLLRILT